MKVLALSCDSAESHRKWIKDIDASGYCGPKKDAGVSYPILADEERALAVKFGMLDPAEKDEKGFRPVATFHRGRSQEVESDDFISCYDREELYEILRVVDSLQLTDEYPVATPANWREK